MLSLHLQMGNLRLSDKVNTFTLRQELEVEKAVARAREEELDLIMSHFTIRSTQSISKSLLPAAPHIFHGRTDDIRRIVQVLLKDEAAYVCILGTGGIGKTTFGLATLHHPQLVKCYNDYRYFVPCDALTDAAGLLRALSSMFSVTEKEFWARFPELCRRLKSKILLMLDNFETPWESAASRTAVEAFLGKLADIPNLSIVLTLHGAERPYGVPWTRPFIDPLTTLDSSSARQIFVEISDVSETSTGLEELLQAVDMLPLAVTLLANQAQFTSCSQLLELWNDQKTAMVTRGIRDRVSNLDISIQTSLASPRLLQFPGALTVLQILSVLPDGASDTGLKQMLPHNFDSTAITGVVGVGLAYRTEAGRLRSLSPVREHLQAFQPMHTDLFCGIGSLHNDLACDAKEIYSQEPDDMGLMIATVTSEIGNIHSILTLSLEKAEFRKDAVTAIAQIHYFHSLVDFGLNRKLLDDALATSRSLGDPILEADCLLAAHRFDSRERSGPYLDGAVEVYRTLGDPARLSECLLAIGHVHLYYDPTRAITAALESINNLQNTTPSRIVAAAYNVIIRACLWGKDLRMAWSFVQRGMASPNVSRRGKAIQLATAADIHGACGQLTASMNCHVRSAEFYNLSGDFRAHASYIQLGQIYSMQSHLSLAASVLERAASILKSTISNHTTPHAPYYTARVAILAGDIQQALSSCQLLHSSFLKAGETSSSLYFWSQQAIVQRLLASALAEVEMHANNWSAALIYIQSAQGCERKLGWVSRYEEVETLLRRADLLTATRDSTAQPLNLSILAAILCSRDNDSFGLSMALQRIADFFYNEEEPSLTAKACYEAELKIIQDPRLNMGANRHAGDCWLRFRNGGYERSDVRRSKEEF